MSFRRAADDSVTSGPGRNGRRAGLHEERRTTLARPVAVGTLACPSCDAPVALAGQRLSPAEPLSCPFCAHSAVVRDFLSLAKPTRPTRVEVRVVARTVEIRAPRGPAARPT